MKTTKNQHQDITHPKDVCLADTLNPTVFSLYPQDPLKENANQEPMYHVFHYNKQSPVKYIIPGASQAKGTTVVHKIN